MKIELNWDDDHEYYKKLESWYPSIFYDLELGFNKSSRTFSLHFGRFTFNLSWKVNTDNYPFDRSIEFDQFKYDRHWFFMDVVDKLTGKDREAEANDNE